MGRKKKSKIEFRYYRMPEDIPFLALLGEKWVQYYGRDVDYLHFHNYLEIGYCYSGTGTLVLGEENYRFTGNQFSVIPKNYPHTTDSDSDTVSKWEYLFIDVDMILEQFYRGGGINRKENISYRINSQAFFKSAEEKPKMAEMIRNIMDVIREKQEFYLEEAKAGIAELLFNIAREKKGTGLVEKLPVKEAAPIIQSLDYIAIHYMEQIKIEDLAGYCHISQSHFRRIFSEYMGMSSVDYINLVRIRAACGYLKRTDAYISDIANKCGFTTFSTFSRNFKQITGVSPNEWRKRPENYEQQLLKFRIHSEKGW